MSKANLANAILASPITSSATSVPLVAGYGGTMPPTVPFKLTLTPFGQLSTRGNSEIILVTARSTDTLTVERGKGGTTAKPFEAGDIASNGIYIENSTAVGDIFMSMRATPADGRVFMDGGTYNKADWPLLYKLVQDNTAYGTTGGGAGTETFTLADFRERMPFGKSQNSPFTTLGAAGGSNTHTHELADGYAKVWVSDSSGRMFSSDKSVTPSWYNKKGTASSVPYTTDTVIHSATELGGSTNSTSSLPKYILVNYEVVAG